MKKWIWILVIFCMGYGLITLHEELTGNFRLNNIQCDLAYNTSWETKPPSSSEQENIRHILNQSFYFLGNGKQSFAFISEDRKYVIKFFRFQNLRPSWYSTWNPFSKDPQRKEKKLEALFNSYKIAYDLDKDHTHLLFVHLNSTDFFNKKMKIIDRLGFSYEIDLDSTVFILQERGEIAKKVLGKLMQSNQIGEVKLKIRSLLDMYVSEYKRGLHDKDYNLMHNTGFVNGKPFRIDPGRMHYLEEMKNPVIYQNDLQKLAKTRLDKWVNRYFPTYREEIMQDIEEKLKEISNDALH